MDLHSRLAVGEEEGRLRLPERRQRRSWSAKSPANIPAATTVASTPRTGRDEAPRRDPTSPAKTPATIEVTAATDVAVCEK